MNYWATPILIVENSILNEILKSKRIPLPIMYSVIVVGDLWRAMNREKKRGT